MAAQEPEMDWQVAECLLPGLTLAVAERFAGLIRAELASRPRPGVALLGAVLMTEDEVLLYMFRGPQAAVLAVSQRAGLPFERIVACQAIGWEPAP
jgi:hypothetical protein